MVCPSGAEVLFDVAAGGDVVEHELDEVVVTVGDRDLGDGSGRLLAGPGDLAGGAVTVQTGAAGGDPLAQPVAGVGEVPVPGQGADGGASGW